MKAEPIMGEKYRGKKVSRKDLEFDVSRREYAFYCIKLFRTNWIQNFSAEENDMSDVDGRNDVESYEDDDDADNFDVVLDESSDEDDEDGDLEDKFEFDAEDEEDVSI